MGATDDEDANANYGDARPAKQIYLFSEEQESENGDHQIRKRGRGLNVTIVRPGKNEHVGYEKGKQARDSKPDVDGGEDSNQDVKKRARLPIARGADAFHSFSKQDIAERSEQSNEEDKNVGFQVQTWRFFHAIRGLLPREMVFVFLEMRPDHFTRCRAGI